MNDETKQQVREIIRQELGGLVDTDHFVFSQLIQLLDGRNIQTGRGTGTMIGTATDQKLGFFGVTPIVQPTMPGSPALSDVVTILKALGLSK